MPNSRMTVVDATYYLESRNGPHLDWPAFWVFDAGNGEAPAPAEVTEHLVRRAHLLSSIRRTPRTVSGNVDYPHWVADDTPLTDHIEHHVGDTDSGMSWSELVDAFGTLAATPLPEHRAWRMHVFHDVRNAPCTSGPATAVALVVSHAMMAGPSLRPVSEALFGDNGEPLKVPGLGAAAPRWNSAARAAAGALATPAALARWWSHLRSGATPAASAPELHPLTRFNRPPVDRRDIRILTLAPAEVRVPGATVTSSVATVISEAMRRYLDEVDGSCPSDLTATVTVALDDLPEELGVNRLGVARVPLVPTLDDLGDRAAAIHAGIRAGRSNADEPSTFAARLRTTNLMPAVLYRGASAQARARDAQLYESGSTLAHTVLSSIDLRGLGNPQLCGRGLALCGVGLPLPQEIGLAHGVIGTDDALTITVHSSPESVPDPDRYLELLAESAARLTERSRPRA